MNGRLSNECVNVSSMNMLKHRIDRYLIKSNDISDKIVGLLISQCHKFTKWLPCPLAIWNL